MPVREVFVPGWPNAFIITTAKRSLEPKQDGRVGWWAVGQVRGWGRF